MTTNTTDIITIGGTRIEPGQSVTIDLPVANLLTHAPVEMPIRVIRGKHAGPTLFVTAAVHGDELNGVEIVRRVLKIPGLKSMKGTLIAVPIVNIYGFLNQSRYLPDRRDLNRSFPGSNKGSLAARLARLILTEIVGKSDYGIDLHTGALHRSNLPQIRADLSNEKTAQLANAFGVPLLLDSAPVEGTLRQHTTDKGIPMLLYESGEALRFDENCIRAGVRGVRNVMRELGMLAKSKSPPRKFEPLIARSSGWVRADVSGILRASVALGTRVRKEQVLGVINDPFGESETEILAPANGIVIGRLNLPLVHEGDAVFHLARFSSASAAERKVERFNEISEQQEALVGDPPIV